MTVEELIDFLKSCDAKKSICVFYFDDEHEIVEVEELDDVIALYPEID